MSLIRFRFIERLAAIAPVQALLAVGDAVNEVYNKLQGQIDAVRAPRLFFDSAKGNGTQTWTVPAGVRNIRFKLVGPGGQGATGADTSRGGGGGSAGGGIEGSIAVNPGDVLSYVVPNANSGTAAWLMANSGDNALVAQAGGSGNSNGTSGAGGGTVIGANHTARCFGIQGQAGQFSAVLGNPGLVGTADSVVAGDGGNSILGFGGRGGRDTSAAGFAGYASSGYGSGGAGACNGASASDQGRPAALVIWY